MRSSVLTAGMLLAGANAISISDCPGYTASNVKTDTNSVTADLTLAGTACNIYGDDITSLKLLVEYQTDQRLHVKIYDADEQVYQIPSEMLSMPPSGSSASSPDLKFNLVEDPFSIAVTRVSNGQVLFNTSGQALVLESQYGRMRTSLPSDPNIYGVGESSDDLRHDPADWNQTLWTSSQSFIPSGTNLYGFYPVYYDHRGSDGMHAVYLHNSNGQKVIMGQDTEQYLEWNTIGGVFDLYFLSGPSPKDVSGQFADLVGHAAMMPYWSFGFHQCKYGYKDVYELAGVVANYSDANIPLETLWSDLDVFDYRATFTLDPIRYPLDLMQKLISHLHDNDQHYITIVEPPVVDQDYKPANDGKSMNIFLKNETGDAIFEGGLWGGASFFPDWFAPDVDTWWYNQIADFYDADTGVDVDGLWLDMNEVSNFCSYPCLNAKQHSIEGRSPPRPPPARMFSPYKVDGFPDEFQPGCFASVNFTANVTVPSGNDMLIIGDALSIGNDTPKLAPNMKTGTGGFRWQFVQLPANSNITYSYPLYTHEGAYIYESQNRTIQTGDCGSFATQVDKWTAPKATTSKRHFDELLAPSRNWMPRNVKSKKKSSKRDGGGSIGLPNRNLLNPPYDIGAYLGPLYASTLPTDIVHTGGYTEYDVHNFYGSMNGEHTRNALIKRRAGERPFILSRSTAVGDGARQAHWFGDNRAYDQDYRTSIVQMIIFPSMFQVPMVGSDVCGFNFNTNPTLCARWAVLGSWYPFFRNHASLQSQNHEFYVWPETAEAASKALKTRYQLLDYLYTAFWKQTQDGSPVISPLMWQYPEDPGTFSIQYQFFSGDALLVSPVTDVEGTSVDLYLPDDTFYNFDTWETVQGGAATITVDNVGLDSIPVYIKGGSVLPMRVDGAATTTALRKEDFLLIIAPDSKGEATGELYLDDGISLESQYTHLQFSYANSTLMIDGDKSDYDPQVNLVQVTLLGASGGDGYNSTTRSVTQTVKLPLNAKGSVDF